MRQDTTVAGHPSNMIVDGDSKVVYMISDASGQKTARKIDIGALAASGSAIQQMTDDLAKVLAKATIVGAETIDGKPASIVEIPPSVEGDSPVRVWLWTERGVPLRMEVPSKDGKISLNYTNYDFAAQPDSLFQLPPDAKVIDAANPLASPSPTPKS